jgi:hypothetical protein
MPLRVTLDEAAQARKTRRSCHDYATPAIDKLAVNSGNLVKLLNVFATIDGQLVILGQGHVPR